jgi:hypothetical protein
MKFPKHIVAILSCVLISACTAQAPPMVEDEVQDEFASLPDWSGVWMGTGTLFDQSSGETSPNTNRNARDFPPYRPDWEAAYEEFLENVVRVGRYSDPLSLGYPPGMLRNMSMPYGIQIIVRPEMVWVIHEGPQVRYIYTDGRPFPPDDELWPTFEGYSIGHWEGDTLVIETVSVKGGIPVDRTGLVFSDEMRVTERIRKPGETTLVNEITIEDPIALTGLWTVIRNYNKREEQYPRMENVSAFENQRNPVVNGVTTTLLADEIDDSDSPYPPEVRAFSLPNIPAP